jgi:molybdopterin-guanine dinucleotide biosynthesis protein A
MEFDEKLQRYTINKQEMFKIVPCDTPLCSPSKLKQIKHELQRNRRSTVKTDPNTQEFFYNLHKSTLLQ